MTEETARFFAGLNATLNGGSAVCMAAGLYFILTRRTRAHAVLMSAAVAISVGFLCSYLYLHLNKAPTRFPPLGWVKTAYLSLLLSHIVLAAAVPPLVAVTLWFAVRRRWANHRRVAWWAFPIWAYVSVTGVLVYWMLYHLAPRLQAAG